jgi:hypothetical protein
MTKMTKMEQILLAMALAAGWMAIAPQSAFGQATTVPGMEMQADGSAGSLMKVKQVKDDLFAGTEKFSKGASDVTEINLDPKMMGMIPGGKSGAAELAHKMRFMVIHTYTYDKPGMYNMDDVDAYRKKLEDGTWSCSVHVRDKSGTTDICSRTSSDHEGTEMVILTAEPKELTFIHMSGNMSLDDLQKMGGGGGGNSDGLKHR